MVVQIDQLIFFQSPLICLVLSESSLKLVVTQPVAPEHRKARQARKQTREEKTEPEVPNANSAAELSVNASN